MTGDGVSNGVTAPVTEVRPWERQPSETAKRWRAFATFRDSGIDRTITATAKTLGVSHQLVSRWSIAGDWPQRAHAYDVEQDRIYWQKVAVERGKLAERHSRILGLVQAKAVARLQTLDPEKLSPGDTLRYLVESIRLQQQVLYGMEGQGAGGGTITVVLDPTAVPPPTVTPDDLGG